MTTAERRVRLVRHAESLSNAGERAEDTATMLLSERGIEQARRWAETIDEQPDLLVLSPFARTQATAAPLLAKFPELRTETWDIAEFMGLPPERWSGTTPAERRALAESFWLRGDLDYIEGPGAESFRMLCQRVTAFIEKLLAREEPDVLVIGHGFFFRCLAWLTRLRFPGERSLPTTPEDMTAFWKWARSVQIGNTSSRTYSRDKTLFPYVWWWQLDARIRPVFPEKTLCSECRHPLSSHKDGVYDPTLWQGQGPAYHKHCTALQDGKGYRLRCACIGFQPPAVAGL